MRHLVLCSLLLACGGDPFSDENSAVGAAGEDSAVAGAGGDSSTTGGTPSSGGKASGGGSVSAAGAPTGGTGTGGTGHAGAPAGGQGGATGGSGTAGSTSGGTGGGVSMCALDTDKLTAALPASFVWQSFTFTNGEDCVTCRDKPCGGIKVLSWGVPQEQPDGSLLYLPDTDDPVMPMNFGTNDGSCTKKVECGLKVDALYVSLIVERDADGWIVSPRTDLQFRYGCASFATAPPAMGTDFSNEISSSLNGLQIPCSG